MCDDLTLFPVFVFIPGKYRGKQNHLPLYSNSMCLNVGSHPENHIDPYKIRR